MMRPILKPRKARREAAGQVLALGVKTPFAQSAKKIIAPLGLLFLTSCALQQDHFEARPVSYAELGGWEEENHAEALASFNQSCPILARTPRAETTGSHIKIPKSVWADLCTKASVAVDPKRFFEDNFTPFRIGNNGSEAGLFTGYYEPLLYGSLHRHGDFIYPVYAAPAGLADSKPYLTRLEIEQGALSGKHLEIVWVDDPVMLFFTHIQGSGRIRLENGKEFVAAYADQNGQGYTTLGKIMADEGLIPKDNINFFTIRQWLYDHHDEAPGMMQRNPSYVFFKRSDELAVKGAVGAPLTPKRSLAVDSRYIPYGLPMYLETTLPDLPGLPAHPFRQILIAQDTGGAIKKPVRGDIFFGHGQEAEYLAGFMKQQGGYSMLVPKEIAPQLQAN